MEFLKTYILIIVFSPLVGSLVIGLSARVVSNRVAHFTTSLFIFISSLLSLKVLYVYALQDLSLFEETLYIWANISDVKFEIGFLVDRLTAIMLFIVTFISLLVHIYTIGYMKGDGGYNRFFSYISFFTFAMLMLVVSNNFLQLFFGWEAVGLASYLLIGFWFKKPAAIFANFKAFIVNRIGDLGFLLGIAAVFCCFGTLNYLEVFDKIHNIVFIDTFMLSTVIKNNHITAITFISMCLFIGAMGKSAQVPLHVWLPDSMEGPTPISALIHAATMVTAGIFMVSRMSPIFEYSHNVLVFILFIGIITCFFMGLLGIVQNDIKRVIAYSTLSQLGLMVAALGVSAYSAAIFHLVTHAFFKALLFLGAGSVIVAMHHEQDIRYMGGLKRYLPITYITMLVGSLALSGFPGFSGFFSKDLIIDAVKFSKLSYSEYAYYILVFSVFITSFYSFRMFFLVFHTNSRIKNSLIATLKEPVYAIIVPLIVLALFSLFSGWALFNSIINNFFKDSIFVKDAVLSSILLEELVSSWHVFLHGFFSLPFFLSCFGIITAWYLYCYNNVVVINIKSRFSIIYSILINKYGFDSFNQYILAYVVRSIGLILWKVGDIFVIDKLVVNGIAVVIKHISSFANKIQTGRLYNYIYIMITGFAILLSCLILKFT